MHRDEVTNSEKSKKTNIRKGIGLGPRGAQINVTEGRTPMAFDTLHSTSGEQLRKPLSPQLELEEFAVANVTKQSALDWVEQRLLMRVPTRVAFMNAHCFNVARRDPFYGSALRRMDALLPDGSGISTGVKLKGQKLAANLNGTDFIPALFDHPRARPLRVFLLGGKPGVAVEAGEKILARHRNVEIVGARDGYFPAAEVDGVLQEISQSGADVMLVAMGVPMQERWIDQHAARLKTPLIFAVGGLFDFLAERVSRAPRFVRALGLEWTWRLAQEPQRMWRRYIIGNPQFMLAAARDAVRYHLRQSHPPIGRAADILFGAAGLVACLPILVPAMLAIKLTSRGPVLFKQTRIGRGGKPFAMLKLRSMYQDAEARRAEMLLQNRHGADAVTFKSKDDPRITPVGRLIRRFSIDELPQFINVLRGDMAMVGPRPPLPSESIRYRGEAWTRLSVTPGLTCFWQIGGRSELGFAEQVRLDMLYINSRDIFTDLEILVKTPLAVLKGDGAC